MTVSRVSGGLSGYNSEAEFQAALQQSMNTGGGGRENRGAPASNGNQYTGLPGNGANDGQGDGNGLPADAYLLGAYRTYIEGGASPVSAQTQALIDAARDYDGQDNADAVESRNRWDAVQTAIADEARMLVPTTEIVADKAGNVDLSQFDPRLLALNMWSLGDDRLALETQRALAEVDTEVRIDAHEKNVENTIEELEGFIEQVGEENSDENIFRRGWDAVTGGGAREDFETFLMGKLERLQGLDSDIERNLLSEEEIISRAQEIMGDFEVEIEKHLENIGDSDGTWNTIGEVGRVVVATAAGILVTATTGNAALGFGAALLTYEIIDVAGDASSGSWDAAYADGHVGITTGLVDLFGGNGGFGMSGENAKTWGMDNALDAISSYGVAGATRAGMSTAGSVSSRLAASRWGSSWGARDALGNRIISTTAGGITAQGVNSAAYMASDATQLGFEGTLFTAEGGQVLADSAKAQAIYLGASLPTSAVAGWIPVYRTIPQGTVGAGAASAGSTGSTGAANAAQNASYKLNYLGLSGQFANDGVSNFATAYAVDGEISEADAIGAVGGMLPGTLQNIAVRPDTQARIDAWRAGRRDLRFTSWNGFPTRVNLPPITLTVLGLRTALLGADAATGVNSTKVANDSAVPLTTIRSSLSKLAWFRGNHRLIGVYDLALRGDDRAITEFEKVKNKRRWHGVKINDTEANLSEVKALLELGKAYARAREQVPENLRGVLPEVNIRDLALPEAFLASLRENATIPEDVRRAFEDFDPDARLLEYSNVVEGLLTDPDFLINALEALGTKLTPDDIDNVRQIFQTQQQTQKLLEMDVSEGGYNNLEPDTPWNELPWRTTTIDDGTTQRGIFDAETIRLNDFTNAFLRYTGTGSLSSNAALKGALEAWQAYVTLYSHSRPDSARQINAIVGARDAYEAAVNRLPTQMRGVLPRGRGEPVMESPQAVLASLRDDPALPPDVRQRLGEFDPNTQLLENPGVVQRLRTDPELLNYILEGLKGKMTDAGIDSFELIIDIRNRLRDGYNNRQPNTTWNEFEWRPTVDENGQQTRPGIFDEERARLDGVAADFLARSGTDADGNVRPEVKALLDAWNAYTALYSQTQHDLAAEAYAPGIRHKNAEQALGSSASPDTRYGYVLKAGAYGVAVNLVASWMLRPKPIPALDVQQASLTGAYGGETILALYNLWGQVGYMKALGKMTEFKAKYDVAEYTPSDKPEDTERFVQDLYREFKEIEAERAKWNKIADGGSAISAGRNLLMAAAFTAMGLPGIALYYAGNAVFSGGWLVAQRPEWMPDRVNAFMTPGRKKFTRWVSIIGSPILQIAATLQAWRAWEQIAEERGPEAASNMEHVMEFLSWLSGHLMADGADVDTSGRPLPDRA